MLGTDLAVHPLCLGTNVFGWTVERDRAFILLDVYLAAGGNFLDTADQYPFWKTGHRAGESETIIGDWMRSRHSRNQLVVTTKVGLMPGDKGLTAKQIRDGAEGSLRRLGTDVIDVYYAHFDDQRTPLEESLGALDRLVTDGKVRYVAASNFSGQRLAMALETSRREGLAAFIAVQERYNLIAREDFESGPRATVQANGLSAFSYSSLASGYLTRRYEQRRYTSSSPQAPFAMSYDSDRSRNIVDRVNQIAARHERTAAAVSLAWLLAQPTIVATVASATSLLQLAELIAAVELELSSDELLELGVVSRPTRDAVNPPTQFPER